MKQERRYIWDVRHPGIAVAWAMLIVLMLTIFGVVAKPLMGTIMLGLTLIAWYQTILENKQLKRKLKDAEQAFDDITETA